MEQSPKTMTHCAQRAQPSQKAAAAGHLTHYMSVSLQEKKAHFLNILIKQSITISTSLGESFHFWPLLELLNNSGINSCTYSAFEVNTECPTQGHHPAIFPVILSKCSLCRMGTCLSKTSFPVTLLSAYAATPPRSWATGLRPVILAQQLPSAHSGGAPFRGRRCWERSPCRELDKACVLMRLTLRWWKGKSKTT